MFNDLQKFAMSQYEDGVYNHCKAEQDVVDGGDTLALFAVREAGDAKDLSELAEMLYAAAHQLEHLAEEALIAKAERG
jgi:hypothetical protein